MIQHPDNAQKEHFKGEAIMVQISDTGGNPLSMKPIPNILNPTFFSFEPLDSVNFSRAHSATMMFPIWSSSSRTKFLACSTKYSTDVSNMCALKMIKCTDWKLAFKNMPR